MFAKNLKLQTSCNENILRNTLQRRQCQENPTTFWRLVFSHPNHTTQSYRHMNVDVWKNC